MSTTGRRALGRARGGRRSWTRALVRAVGAWAILVTAVALLPAALRAPSAAADAEPACDTTWTGGAGTDDVRVAANWSDGAPIDYGTEGGPGLHACLPAGAHAVLDSQWEYVLTGLTVEAGATFEVRDGRLHLDGGPLVNRGTLRWSNPWFPFLDLAGGTFTNQGTVEVTQGDLDLRSGTVENTGDVVLGAEASLALGDTVDEVGPGSPAIDFVQVGGTISGPGAVYQLSGTFSYQGGDLSAVTVYVTGYGHLDLAGATGAATFGFYIPGCCPGYRPAISGTIQPAHTVVVGPEMTRVTHGALNLAGDLVNRGVIHVPDSFGYGIRLAGHTLINEGTLDLLATSTAHDLRNGTVVNHGRLVVPSSADRLVLTGATIENHGEIALDGELRLDVDRDALNVSTLVNHPGASVAGDGWLSLSGWGGDGVGGRLIGVGSVGVDVVSGFDTVISPGFSPGILELGSLDLAWNESAVDLEIAGLVPGAGHDQINVAGHANLNGMLRISMLDGYVPPVCSAYTVMTWGSRSGTPDLIGTDLGGGVELVPVYLPDRLVLVATDTGVPISVNPTAVNVAEGGATAEVNVCLGTDPNQPVTVTATPDAQVTTAPASLTFLPGETLVQTLTVEAVDDLVVEGDHVGTVGLTSSSAEAAFDGLVLPDVVATIADNDLPGGAPEAFDDAAVTDEDQPVVIDVLANDTSTDPLDPATVTVFSEPGRGTATVEPDGTITYEPDPDVHGIDTFTYRVRDVAAVQSNAATVTVDVAPVPDPPFAVDDVATTPVDTAVAIEAVLNDGDVDGDPIEIDWVESPVTGEDPEGVLGPAGVAEVSSPSTVTYTPDPGFVGEAVFEYRIHDGTGLTAQASITVTVTDGVVLPPPTVAPPVPVIGPPTTVLPASPPPSSAPPPTISPPAPPPAPPAAPIEPPPPVSPAPSVVPPATPAIPIPLPPAPGVPGGPASPAAPDVAPNPGPPPPPDDDITGRQTPSAPSATSSESATPPGGSSLDDPETETFAARAVGAGVTGGVVVVLVLFAMLTATALVTVPQPRAREDLLADSSKEPNQ